ncbi:MAG: hypothetical protein AB9891_13670 [Anaerolineaceae bacterium]
MNKVWLRIFQIELLVVGTIFIFAKNFFSILIGADRIEQLERFKVFPILLILGILVILLTAVFFFSRISLFLRSNKLLGYFIPLQIMLVGILVVMELVLRVTVYNQPVMNIQTNWFGSLPASDSYYLWGSEGYAVTKYDGLPGEIRTPFQGGENVILLGDSFLEGLQVSDDQKLASVAETMLRQDGYLIDLHNLGASGMSMADYVAYIPKYRELYQPAAFVLVIQDNDFIESFDNDKANYFIEDKSKIVETVSTNRMDDEYQVAETPYLVFRPILYQYGRTRIEKMMADPVGGVDVGGSRPAEFNAALAKQQMDLLIDACDGTSLIILIYPHAPYISGDGIEMNDEKHETLRAFLSGYSEFTLVDPLPAMQELTEAGTLPLGFFNSPVPGAGHLNADGNKVVGQVLARAIAEVLK